MSKAVASRRQVIDSIVSSIFNVEAGIYRVDETEWANGTRSDLVLTPDVIDNEQRPLIVEFQKTVDRKFIKRAMSYCLQASIRYDIDPVILIVCTGTITESLKEKFQKNKRLPFCVTIPCDLWAAECLILSKETIEGYINVEESLHPLVAFGMFLTYQASTITLLPRSEDPTLVLLYEIAEKSFQKMYYKDISLLEELKNMCDTQLHDYKNMMTTLQNKVQPLDTILTSSIHLTQGGKQSITRKADSSLKLLCSIANYT
ncbi:uncharacterized protein EV154DRAFT_492748 [Mucor mucedo]|uniref:uncharacterized protein n=1 Tax=Mucor mucedo TaxID=29922 RepID=UPI002220076B|nr:uncharacterized protein EV154DRAFT_492748 [Mucor mucedo]KAI7896230.1 hypothetical protein EV154DRAFT_492748 [Mucor mucedo]